MTTHAEPTIRPFEAADTVEVLRLLSRSLGWVPDDHHAAFFDWKHRQNPFGPSLAWVAEDEGRILGVRPFLRWEFEQPGAVVTAVRAVDTATAPEARGRGVFTALTRFGLHELEAAGVGFVFNTPNDQSRPGYLKMGWREVGRVPVRVRVASVAALRRLAGARTPADLWSLRTEAGQPAADALADRDAVAHLLQSRPPPLGVRTRLTPEVLHWRYAGFPALAYRAVTGPGGVTGGLALFRLRRRGRAVEAMIGDILSPGGDAGRAAALAKAVLRDSRADYAIVTGGRSLPGFVPLPGQGPVLTWRGVCAPAAPPLAQWALSLGDIELL